MQMSTGKGTVCTSFFDLSVADFSEMILLLLLGLFSECVNHPILLSFPTLSFFSFSFCFSFCSWLNPVGLVAGCSFLTQAIISSIIIMHSSKEITTSLITNGLVTYFFFELLAMACLLCMTRLLVLRQQKDLLDNAAARRQGHAEAGVEDQTALELNHQPRASETAGDFELGPSTSPRQSAAADVEVEV